MSMLIDLFRGSSANLVKIGNKWFVARPVGKFPIKDRIMDSYKVLTGKAIAVHFREDELDEIKRRKNKCQH